MAAAKYSKVLGDFQHYFAGLLPPEDEGVALATSSGMICLPYCNPDDLKGELAKYDIIHVHWWNNPQLNAFLRSGLPECRLLIWFHVGGQALPQIVTDKVVAFADFALAGSPYTYEAPAFQKLDERSKIQKTGIAYDPADFDRLRGLVKKAHKNFNIGFIGTVDYLKMHPRYFEMSAATSIPDVKFIVCGPGAAVQDLLQRSREHGLQERFDIRGYVSDIRPVLEIMDIYGYPLCEDNYSAAELNLQEVMYAGIPPVVFPYGGVKRLVEHDRTGLVVSTEREYVEALEYLYKYPAERERLGNNAAGYARDYFGAENASRILNGIYQNLTTIPKRPHFWGERYNPFEAGYHRSGFDALPLTPAEIFIETLGPAGVDYAASLQSTDIRTAMVADERISRMSKTMQMTGVLPYKDYYPQDFYLRLWAALSFWGAGLPEHALVEYSEALKLSNPHWRVLWYFALAAIKIKQWQLANAALEQLRSIAPAFEPAHALSKEIEHQDVVLLDNGLMQINLEHRLHTPI
ncbi:MAG: glycosyltransferase family 4 protein [SAR324 cluster bacterium]|uniref:Glycosyltransferase family 4 protein n=1 Tax=SAR324 cluster bacterium TaxID=2024889 RepID=A0A7X9FPI1_9DELT|nr:glycosyltransferase family 4 protein [SAR324 cluster bacterium]